MISTEGKSIVVVGATGKQGGQVARHLLQQGWRVRALTGINGTEIGEWSQIWKTRFDLSLGLQPTTGAAPQLVRPVHTAEFVETTPLLEWQPLEGAELIRFCLVSLSSGLAGRMLLNFRWPGRTRPAQSEAGTPKSPSGRSTASYYLGFPNRIA